MHNGQKGIFAGVGPGEIVERLLLDSDGEAHRERHRNFARIAPDIAMQRTDVGNQELALNIVVSVIAGSPRQNERALNTPSRSGAKIEPSARKQRLRNRILRVLDAPRSQILGERCGGQSAAELMLQPGIGCRIEILFDDRPEQQITRRISGDQ